MKDKLHFAALIADKIQGKITPEQERELEDWLNESPENLMVYQRAMNRRNQLDKLKVYALFDKDKVKGRLEAELFPSRKVDFNPRRLLQWAAAILLPILVAGSIYLYVNAPGESKFAELNQIIQPGTQTATLVLSTGETVSLEGDNSSLLLAEGSVKITNTNKILNYSADNETSGSEALRFNELRVPSGGNYQLKLSDGTRVWLNAASTLKFPVTFSKDSRDIYLEGEAYFEVPKTGSSFVVHTAEMDVSVLGTSFNVSAYKGDEVYKTTLVEGIVLVDINTSKQNQNESVILKPSEQALLAVSSKQLNTTHVNTAFYTSWMKGKIEFNNDDLNEVMKRLSRWYNFEYIFETETAKDLHFTGRLDKNENISGILEMLELTTNVRFSYENGKVNIQ